ncbi:hypothetical protein DLM45_04375 [Hyphomicrobium methylovorum]|uniref:DUF1217 domain-containing protein n=1 Tax=Hyphomicrobium methylovorum TaxID=84 RepID=UPI0015E67FE5|nr:DUF1217 domain-containing protein [Hyphomicrobium methylovorum]MBA2125460.1 hypothetical protein [Hyphomicrobium methylovorum]
MISTFVSYRILAADLTKSLSRVASEAQVKRDSQYYKDNIGKVKSVDDFMKNSRVYSYAMKAYGLQDMSYAKAFMRKVLESDLTDPKSFVRKLTDPRFLQFAQAFNFSKTGEVSASPVAAQEVNDEADTIGLYSDQRIKRGAAAAAEAEYYRANIGSITSVDQLIAQPRLLNYAVTAYGFDANIMSDTTLRGVLTSDLSDPNSLANTLPSAGFRYLAAAFNFATDGSVNGASAQSDDKIAGTIYRNMELTGNGSSPAAAALKTQYYQTQIPQITSVDDFLADDQLLNYALTGVGLDPIYQSKPMLRDILTSDLNDPNSAANQASGAYRTLAAAFNFGTDGSAPAGQAQSTTQMQSIVDTYMQNYDDDAVKSEESATTFYKEAVSGLADVDELVANSRLYRYVLTAYGLDPSTESKNRIKLILTSDLSDPGSYANQSRNTQYKALAAAFNFGTNGKAQTVSSAQTNTGMLSTVQLYNAAVEDPKAANASTKAESTYYGDTLPTIKSVDGLLKDKRLVDYILKAYGFADAKLSNDDLKKILTSDPLDEKSFVNKKGKTIYRTLAAAFNFDADGKVRAVPSLQAQDRSNIISTFDYYARQTLEEEAGSQNEGVRLALYFQRKAKTITSAYSILGDKALLQVTQTALGLPAAMSNADIDLQANMITKKLKIADLQDPKKLEAFISRFAALYDLNNSPAATPSLMI